MNMSSSSADASLVSFLQSELLSLSNEIKKKYPEIKESIENIFQLIRKIKDDPDRPNAVDVFSETELILHPIILSSRTGNSRVIAISLNCLQRLVSFKAFPRECIGSVFSVLESVTEMNSDIQLKSLQCLSPLMTNYNDLYGSELIRLFSIAFKLQESKVGMVNNASAAIIRQMIISLFEWVGEEISTLTQIDTSVFVPSHAQDALLILSDIVCRLDEGNCEVLDLSRVDKPFSLDLIESVLVNHGDVIRLYKPFALLIQDRICPYLIDNLKEGSSNSNDFPKTCRHWRIIQFFITEFNDVFPDEIEIFIAFGIRTLRESKMNWECAMVLEVTKSIFQSQNLIEEIYLICEKKESPRIFKDLMEVMLETMKEILDSNPSDSQGQIIDAMGKSSVLTQFDKSSPPSVSPIALLLLSYEAFIGWYTNLSGFLKLSCTQNNALDLITYKSLKNNPKINPKTSTIITDLILFIGTGLNRIMDRILIELCYNQPQLFTLTLDFFYKSIVIYSVFEFRSQLRQLMNILLNFITLKHSKNSNNLLIVQIILESGLSLGELLEDSLISIVKVLQITEKLRDGKCLDDKLYDLSVKFIESTVIWDEKSFTFLIQSYGNYIIEETGADPDTDNLILVLGKLKRLTSLNMIRFIEGEKCSNSWELLMEEYCKMMKSKDSTLRQFSVDIFSSIIDLFMKSIPSTKMKASRSKPSDSSCDSLQMRILSPLTKVSNSVRWIDVQKVLLDSLMRYINVYEESLNETSWNLIWNILKENLTIIRSELESSEPTDNLFILYQKVHDIIKIVSSDFLGSIPISSFSTLIDIISEIGEINLPGELNIPLNTVRYLWDISDFLCNIKNFTDVFDLWKGLLIRLTKLSLDSRPELRNSSLQTLLRTINMNGSSLKGYADKWNCLFDGIIFIFLKDLRETSKLSKQKKLENDAPDNNNTVAPLGIPHFSRDSESKQWDETESNAMTGVTTIFLTHFKGILVDLPNFHCFWRDFLQILREYAVLKDGSIELTSVAVNCLHQLCLGLQNGSDDDLEREDYNKFSMVLWEVWKSICEENNDKEENNNGLKMEVYFNFTQDSLLKYFKIFPPLLDSCKISLPWLESSLKVLSAALKCPTPSDQVRDVESATEVQKFLVNQILNELIKKKEGKGLIIKEISSWLRLICENNIQSTKQSGSIEMISMGYQSIRSRTSTSSSFTSKSSSSDQNGIIKYSYIAMTGILLEKIPELFTTWRDDDELYSFDSLSPLLESLGKFMQLKYKCPSNSKMTPIWRSSASVFNFIMMDVFQSEHSDLCKLWIIILDNLKGTLHSSKEMFNRTLKIESIESDERFDCQLLDLIVDYMIPRALKDEQGFIVEESINLLFQISRITKFSSDNFEEDSDFLFPSGVKSLPISVKEILSFSAYKSIFKLVKSNEEIKEIILEKLTNLLKKHLTAFHTDRRIFGNDFPFPRLRDLELHILLQGMINLSCDQKLRQLYDLIVRCADFGGSGCDGAKMIVKDCRKVLLLLGEIPIEDIEEDLEDCYEGDFEEEETFECEEDKLDRIKRIEIPLSIPLPPVISVPLKLSPSTLKTTISSRRSISEELFEHLSHDLRIMQMEDDKPLTI